jgi:hypothetical protein
LPFAGVRIKAQPFNKRLKTGSNISLDARV